MTEVVIVDDDLLTAEFVGEVVRGLGLTVTSAQTLNSARAAITGATRAVFVDVYLGTESGTDLISELSQASATAGVPVVAMTGSDDPEVLAELDRLGVVALLPKPFDVGEVAALLQAVIETGLKNKRPPSGGL